MLNKLWGAMILLAILTACITGRVPQLTQAFINGGKDAVSLCITMLGIVATWTGIMKIAEKGGLIQLLSKKMSFLLRFLFPDIPKDHPASQYIATNFIANFLGLGWAATPAGIAAMKEMDRLNKQKGRATRAMCMFLVINMSSIQLISVNMLAYRDQYGSANPAEIVGPSLIATLVSTFVGVVAAKLLERRD